jgi:hypothetical protein
MGVTILGDFKNRDDLNMFIVKPTFNKECENKNSA